MFEGFSELSLNDAYTELRRILLDMKCQPLWTIPPEAIEVRQGSWLGLSPSSMVKHIRFRLSRSADGTRLEGVVYWPLILTASLVIFYTACFFLLGFVALIITQGGMIPLFRTPFGTVVVSLILIVVLLSLIHFYSYLKRWTTPRQILLLMKVRGSPMHRRIRDARMRKID
jgi:hypothetical protein